MESIFFDSVFHSQRHYGQMFGEQDLDKLKLFLFEIIYLQEIPIRKLNHLATKKLNFTIRGKKLKLICFIKFLLLNIIIIRLFI